MTRVRPAFPLLIGLSILLWPAVLAAQVDRSSLTGTVSDAQGNGIPNAEVRATHIATGFERKTKTSAQGSYFLESLPPGRFIVVIAKPGFAEIRVEQVEQAVGQTHTLDAQLNPAQTSQQTTVNEPVVQLDRASAVVGGVIEGEQVSQLPLNGRNWAHLTSLVPGAMDTGSSDQRSIRFAGHGLDDNNFTFDGVDASGVLNQAQKQYVRLSIPLDSISEFQVKAQNFNADTGTTAGGQVSVASSSGSNQFHGSAFDYLRNDVFDARSPFDGSSPAPLVLNQFGGSVGGPIVQDGTFFFANYEGLRQRVGQTQIGLVPSPSFISSAELQSPGLASVLSQYPAGTSSTTNRNISNYAAGANQVDNEDSGSVRLDRRFSQNTTAFVRFGADEADYNIPTGNLNSLSETDTKLKNGVVELLHVFSPAVVSEAKFGLNQDIYHTADNGPTPYTIKVPGLSQLTNNETTDGDGTTYSYLDDTTWVKGKHILKFGVEIRTIHMNQGNSQNGTLTYSTLGGFLDNQINNATFADELPLKRLRKTQSYAYVQDEFKATRNLIITLGLRYSFFNVFHEVSNRAIPFDLETCGGFCSPSSDFTHPRYDDFDPRVAAAWSHGNTVVRLGAGMYHSDGQEDDQNLPISNDVGRYTLSAAGSPGLSYPIDSFLAATTGIVTPRDMYRDRKDFYVSAWTASVQQSLPGSVVGTLAYAGNKGTDVLTTTYQNINPAGGVRPYSQFGVIEFRGNDSNSTFHSLEASARRAFRHGVLLSVNYMWSHSINDDGIGGGESDTPQDVFCRACEKASSDFDIRHIFNATTVYDLPFGPGKPHLSQPGFARALFGGWQISGVATARSGLPVNITVDRSNAAVPGGYSVSGSERPDLVPGVSLIPANQNPDNWINPAAFSVPVNGAFGNAGRNLLRGPGLWQIDSSLAKRISLTERLSLEARGEVYNIFNRAQYGNPLADISSPVNFGQIVAPVNQGVTGSGTPRQVQFALRLSF